MAQSTAPRLADQVRSLRRPWDRDPEFGLGEVLSPRRLRPLLKEEGADGKECLYTPVCTFWAFLWPMLSPDRSASRPWRESRPG